MLGADVAARRYFFQNTVEFHAALPGRHGRIEELRKLDGGEHATAALSHDTKTLKDLGRAQEAETDLREIIDATDHPNHRSTLVDLLTRQGRIAEAIEVARPTFEYYDCGNHLEWVVHLLVEDGRPEQALTLLDECSAEYVKEHSYSVRSKRLWLLTEAGRHQEATVEAMALPAEEHWDRDTVIAGLLKETGRVDEAIALLRSPTASRAPLELAELLTKQGRPAEALAALPLPIRPTRAGSPVPTPRRTRSLRLIVSTSRDDRDGPVQQNLRVGEFGCPAAHNTFGDLPPALTRLQRTGVRAPYGHRTPSPSSSDRQRKNGRATSNRSRRKKGAVEPGISAQHLRRKPTPATAAWRACSAATFRRA